jgi:hypothetical protein
VTESSFSARIRMAREALRRIERRLGIERRHRQVAVVLERRAHDRRAADRLANGKPEGSRDGIAQKSADRPAGLRRGSYFAGRVGRSPRRGSTNQRTNAITPRILRRRRVAKLGLSFSFQYSTAARPRRTTSAGPGAPDTPRTVRSSHVLPHIR